MNDTFTLYPKKKIQPYDGMSITAGVWAEAHDYHARMLNAHQHFLHGAGIVGGLEVVASDPAATIVYILPGVALDGAGQMIVLPEPVAYDLGQKMEGKLRLLLIHREMKTPADAGEESNAPAYVQHDYVVVARADAPDVPHVELARIDRDPRHPVTDAANAFSPQPNQLDLRYRQYAGAPPAKQVRAGVCSLGEPVEGYAQGVIHLADFLAAQSRYRLVVEDAVPLDASLLEYGLVVLVAAPSSRLSKEQGELLRAFLENGGRLLVEFSGPVEDGAAAKLLKPAGVVLEALAPGHPVYQKPNLFFSQPAGSLPGQVGLWSWGGVVLCAQGGYGGLWSGRAAPELLSRSNVRDALEWGANLVSYLLAQD